MAPEDTPRDTPGDTPQDAPHDAPGAAGESRGDLIGFAPWAVFFALLVFGGLALSAGAGDTYMMTSGLLFAAFGVFLGFRLLDRMLP